MTKVFVHGVPEVAAIWDPLVDALVAGGVDDVVLLSPPGFGAPIPASWSPSMDTYATWLITELEPLVAAGGPVDLVGHDWGAGHVFGALVRGPDLVRTWATDVVGLIHPDYVWHDTAQAWQTPDLGEQVIDAMVGMNHDDRTATFAALGLTGDVLTSVAAGLDADMGRCILALYRDATQPAMADLGAASKPATCPRDSGSLPPRTPTCPCCRSRR